MTTTRFVSGSTLSDGDGWANDADTVVYSVLGSVAGTNTITAAGPASMIAYVSGQRFFFIPAVTNTSATTINITPSGGSALGAKNIFAGGAACVGEELPALQPRLIEYDGTQFNIVGSYLSRAAWTPALKFGGASVGMTYTTQVGRYIKYGPHVVAQFRIVLSAKGSSTGAATITALPATSANVTGLVGSNAFGGTALSSIAGNLSAIVAVNGTTASLEYSATGTAVALTETNFGDVSDISGTLVYLAAS